MNTHNSIPGSAQPIHPVIKRPRSEWRIPALDAYARLIREKQEAERRAALCEGTTPQGRELFRKIVFHAERMIDENRPNEEIRDAVMHDLTHYQEVLSEFVILFGRAAKLSVERLEHLRRVPLDLAILLIIYLRFRSVASGH